MLAGLIFEYIGAFLRWLVSDKRKTIHEIVIGSSHDDIYKDFSDSIFNKILGFIGLLLFLLIIYLVLKLF